MAFYNKVNKTKILPQLPCHQEASGFSIGQSGEIPCPSMDPESSVEQTVKMNRISPKRLMEKPTWQYVQAGAQSKVRGGQHAGS